MNKRKRVLGAMIMAAFVMISTFSIGCSSSTNYAPCPACGESTPQSLLATQGVCNDCYKKAEESQSEQYSKQYDLPDSAYNYDAAPSYENPLWPTNNPELLAIPESDRWYNAWDKVGTNCTVAGPVVNVYQATDSAGMPIFVDIGAAYPSTDCVSLVIWADSLADFEEMLYDVDHGNAWISVTGYLSDYYGYLQFDISDGYVEYTWWTNVN